MTRVAWTYRWSSAAAHTGRSDAAHLLDLEAWNDLVPDVNWKEMLTALQRYARLVRSHTAML